jgi:PKD domain
MKYLFTSIIFFFFFTIHAQVVPIRAFFIGNSYTAVNNLPKMIADVASSGGDTLYYDSNIPGGYTFQLHLGNPTTLSKIAIGNWDYVILQEQSQLPSFPINQVQTDVFPYARVLDSLVNSASPCGETVFYMTWGRKNGDASNCVNWPPVCTYNGMDSLLRLRYNMMADSNDAFLSPVGKLWNYIRQNFPLIVLFRKDPSLISFDASLPATDAANIRDAARTVVFDSLLSLHVGEYDPQAGYIYNSSGVNQITFVNTSDNFSNAFWDFGDGNTSSVLSPVHQYNSAGVYTVKLVVERCGKTDSLIQQITAGTVGINIVEREVHNEVIISNPVYSSVLLSEIAGSFNLYKIFNAEGACVVQGKLNPKELEINFNFPAGFYVLELYAPGLISYSRFLKID